MIIIDDVFLGRAALGAQRPIVIKLSRGRSVDASVCPVLCGKMADRIIGPVSYTHLTLPTNREV